LLYSIGSGWIHMDRSMKHEYYDVKFSSGNDELQLRLRPHRCEEPWQLDLAELEQSTMRQFDQILKRDLKELYQIHAKTDWRLFQLTPEMVDSLSALSKVPWVQYVQRKCLLTILRWPKRIPSRERWGFGSMSDPKPYIP